MVHSVFGAKIAIPNNVRLKCISWNTEQGWIAVGGESGLLKILKLDSEKGKNGVGASGNLTMNQPLEGHAGNVVVMTWNENYRKLTTSDQFGLIIVWMLHKNLWFEEMINNRNKSVVRDMKWTPDGQKICITYQDGAVIVGSVEGTRLWGKDFDLELEHVEWSPDGRSILFGTAQSEVHIVDNHGNFLAKLPIYAIESAPSLSSSSSASMEPPKIAGLEWYHGSEGYSDPNAPTMALAFDNGRIQIMRHDTDDNPVLIDCGMNIRKIRWSTNGTVLAVAGYKNPPPAASASTSSASTNAAPAETQMVQFYSPYGKHLRTLKVPGTTLNSLTWEAGSLRLALAVDSFIYFANIRPDYKWGHFGSTLIYAFNKPDRVENCVCFWNTDTDEKHIKYVKKLMSIRAGGEHCVLATRTDDQSGQFILILCNAIGSPIDSHYVDVEPVFMAMTGQYIIVASQQVVYVWQYKLPTPPKSVVPALNAPSTSAAAAAAAASADASKKKEGIERIFHVDDPPSSAIDPRLKQRRMDTVTSDPICAVCCSDSTLIIGRASGTLVRYSLPHLVLEQKYVVRCRPQSLSLNCNSTRLSIIDINGVLTFFDLDARNTEAAGTKSTIGVHLKWERKDAWDMIWSDDNPDLFACMEKTRMYVFRGLNPEEPVQSNGYLCSFNDLCIKSVLLDEMMKVPDQPQKENVLMFETKSLRDTRDLLATTPIQEAYQFVDDNPHPRLWKLIAEAALEQLNFLVADKAFVRCHDYQGIQFVKRLKLINDKNKQKAEVATYFRRFEEAESIFLKADAKDLAIELRTRLGDWFRVVQLIQSGGSQGGNDALLTQAYSNIGDYYADRQKWDKAAQFYTKAKNIPALVTCSYYLEDFSAIEKYTHQLPEGSPALVDIGEKLMSVGLGSEAVHAFLKSGNIKAAVDCCVVLNQWDSAVELAEAHNFPQIETLLTKYASHLLEKNKTMQAIELYRKANRHTDAARLLSKLAKEASTSRVDPLRVKKLYVLAALHVDRFRRKVLDQSLMGVASSSSSASALASIATGASSAASSAPKTQSALATMATMNALMAHDSATGQDKSLDLAWRGAEAYHFLMLAQRQLYAGAVDAAMKTSLRLMDYDDLIEPREIYSLIALTSLYNKFYGQASRAFIKLEALDGASQTELDKYQELAIKIFVKNRPEDPATRDLKCPAPKCQGKLKEWSSSCSDCGEQFAACIVTGKALLNSEVFHCKVCKHKAGAKDIRGFNNCPLCHSPIVSI